MYWALRTATAERSDFVRGLVATHATNAGLNSGRKRKR